MVWDAPAGDTTPKGGALPFLLLGGWPPSSKRPFGPSGVWGFPSSV